MGYLISVFLHIVFAAFWIGGMLFLPLVLLPAIKDHPNRIILLHKTGIKFRFYGWIVLIGLMITGFYNMHMKGLLHNLDFILNSDYGKILGIKLSFFAAMVLIGGIHDFYIGEKAIEQMQQNNNTNLKTIARWSGRINLTLALAIAFLGVAMTRGGF